MSKQASNPEKLFVLHNQIHEANRLGWMAISQSEAGDKAELMSTRHGDENLRLFIKVGVRLDPVFACERPSSELPQWLASGETPGGWWASEMPAIPDSTWLSLTLQSTPDAQGWCPAEWEDALKAYDSDIDNAIDDILDGLMMGNQWFVAAFEHMCGTLDPDTAEGERARDLARSKALLDVATRLGWLAREQMAGASNQD